MIPLPKKGIFDMKDANNKEALASNQAKDLAEAIAKILDDKKGMDVTVLAVGKQTVLADYFVIATGTSSTHVNALADEVEFKLKEDRSLEPGHIEGHGEWVLLDYASVIVHVFTKNAREFYKLEKLWSDAGVVSEHVSEE